MTWLDFFTHPIIFQSILVEIELEINKEITSYGTKTVNGSASDDRTFERDEPSREACKPVEQTRRRLFK